MRIRTGHGPKDWTDNVPSEARTALIGGTVDFVPPVVDPSLHLKGESPDTMRKMNDARYKAMGRGRAA